MASLVECANPRCKKPNPSNFLKCGYCKTLLVKQATCPQCGQVQDMSFPYCNQCEAAMEPDKKPMGKSTASMSKVEDEMDFGSDQVHLSAASARGAVPDVVYFGDDVHGRVRLGVKRLVQI